MQLADVEEPVTVVFNAERKERREKVRRYRVEVCVDGDWLSAEKRRTLWRAKVEARDWLDWFGYPSRVIDTRATKLANVRPSEEEKSLTDELVEKLEVRLEVGYRDSENYTPDEALMRQALARIVILKRENESKLAELKAWHPAYIDDTRSGVYVSGPQGEAVGQERTDVQP